MRFKHISVFVFVLCAIIMSTLGAQLNGCQQGATSINGIVNIISPWYCSELNPQITQVWQSWLPIMLIAITVSFSIATMLFLFGVVLKNDRLRTFGIGELYEAFATTIIVGLFLFIAAVMFGLLPAITAGPIDPYDAALSYIATTINVTASTSNNLFNVVAASAYYASIGFQTDAGAGEIKTPPILSVFSFAIYYYFFWPAWSVVVFLVEALMSLYTQYYLILFTMYSSIPIFLIPGILFRTFIPTRHLGGVMIGMAIGFYFIMPTLFAVAYYYTSNSITTQLALANSAVARYGNNAQFIQNAATPQAPLALAVSQMSSSFSAYWMSILFFPALIIAVTYSVIMQVAELLGGMSKSSSRLRALV